MNKFPFWIATFFALLLVAGCASGSGGPKQDQVSVATVGPTAMTEVAPADGPTPQAPQVDPPTTGHWIDVDLTNLRVSLMSGATLIETIAPVAIGREIDTGVYESTQTGLFHVYVMDETLAYDAPYDTYISHWVGFDSDKANGFHSFLKDSTGAVVDDAIGRISNGCIRTGDPEAIFAFAEIGMPVLVHH